jgi:hypothetical protein
VAAITEQHDSQEPKDVVPALQVGACSVVQRLTETTRLLSSPASRQAEDSVQTFFLPWILKW